MAGGGRGWRSCDRGRTLFTVEESSTPEQLNSERDLVVMGASAGGVETLKAVVAGLPDKFPAAVCVVLHIAPSSPSALADILGRAGRLPCRSADDGETLRSGEILVAPPDRHLVVEDGRVRLTVGPRENGHRPSVDALFRSAASQRADGVVGVILSGTRDDGAAGMAAIKANGGATVVQDPDDALYGGMPASALAHLAVDAVVPSAQIAETVVAIVRGEELPASGDLGHTGGEGAESELITVCPECGGVLTERPHVGMLQWHCHVGHRFSPRSLVDAQGDGVEMALWAAVRMLRDRAALFMRMAEYADNREQARSARRFRSHAHDAGDQADLVLDALNQAAASTLGDTEVDHDEGVAAESGG